MVPRYHTMLPRPVQICVNPSVARFANVCIENAQYDAAGTLLNEYGCAALGEQDFTLDKKLRSATLAPTMITLNGDGTSRTVEVSASMQSVGELEKVNYPLFAEHSGCTFDTTTRGHNRAVATTVTLDGQVISGAGGLYDMTDTTVVRCD